MPKATFDPARLLDLYFRISRNGSKKFVFIDQSGAPYDVSGLSIQMNIKDYDNSSSNRLQLTPTITGNGNEATFTITDSQSKIREQKYYWELYVSSTKKTWLTGDAHFHDGRFDGVGEDGADVISINDGGTITIQITESGGGSSPVDAFVPPFIFDDFISYVDEANSNIGVGWYRDPITQYNTGVAVDDLYGVININNSVNIEGGYDPCSISLFAQIEFSKFKEMKFRLKSSKTVGFISGLFSSSGGLYALSFTQAADSEFWLARTSINGVETIIPSTKVITEGGVSNWYTFKITNVDGLVNFYIDEELVHSVTLNIPDEAPLITNFSATGGEDETYQSEFSLDYYLLRLNDTRNIF